MYWEFMNDISIHATPTKFVGNLELETIEGTFKMEVKCEAYTIDGAKIGMM